jgi:hypothetical protein
MSKRDAKITEIKRLAKETGHTLAPDIFEARNGQPTYAQLCLLSIRLQLAPKKVMK